MNFNQWKGHAAKGSVAKVTYCCGDQPALVELVVDDIKSILAVPITDYVEIDAKNDSSMWDAASQYPLDPNVNRLVVVRNAEAISYWEPLFDWLAVTRGNTTNYLLFVSHQPDAPTVYAKGKRVGYEDHIEIIRTKGKLIKCSQPNDEDLIKWSQSYGLTELASRHLIDRVSGDTTAMLEVFHKVAIWSGSPNTKAIDLLCEEQALDSFADYLMMRDKKTAFLALQSATEDDLAKVITRLDHRLDMMLEIGKYVRRRMYAGDIAATTGIKIYLVKRFMPVVKDYDDRKIKKCRQVLALIDGFLRDGAKVGVWESLIALW
jgi:hypothetical protein